MSWIHHIALAALDLETSEMFYLKALKYLNLQVRKRSHDEHGLRSVWLCTGENETHILMLERATVDSIATHQRPPCVVFRIAVSERISVRSHIESLGVSIDSETEYSFYFRDPAGNSVGLSHYPERNDNRQE